jgi:serine/threonine protein kinase
MAAMTATILDAVSAGRVIDGRFPLLQKLGETERTSAWLTELDDGRVQKVAIKIFPLEFVDADATLARWDVARTLSHPHLMPLFEAGRCELDGEDLLYVVTEYADETLSQVLPERCLTPGEALEMLGPILDALSYLHKLGLTHGHLRPANIMVVDNRLKLSPDFGWCSRTRSIYDAPEGSIGVSATDGDIWSLGVLLVESLTQHAPFWDRSQGGEPEIPEDIPEPFLTICRECLRRDPERRCSLASIKAHLGLTRPAEPVIQSNDAVIDRTDHPPYMFYVKILIGTALALLFLMAAFKFGWDLTP